MKPATGCDIIGTATSGKITQGHHRDIKYQIGHHDEALQTGGLGNTYPQTVEQGYERGGRPAPPEVVVTSVKVTTAPMTSPWLLRRGPAFSNIFRVSLPSGGEKLTSKP